MFRKMILALTAVIALTAWASAKPGTWGKENPVNENEAKAPAVKFNQWLNEFSKAYEQRDSEAMDELIKRFDDVKQDHPAVPRIEKWMDNVKEAYKEENIQKMGKLLDNARQVRERMRERFVQNQNRPGRNEEGFGREDRQMRGRGFGRPDRMRPDAQMFRGDRAFDGRGPRFNARRDMEPGMRPDGFDGGRFRGPMHDDKMGPRMRNRFERPQNEGDMNYHRMTPPRRFHGEPDRPFYGPRPDFDRQEFGPRMRRPQHGPRNDNMRPDIDRRRSDNMPPDFWG